MQETAPAEVFCLAEFLSDEMTARGWTSENVAVRMKTKRGAAMDLFIFDMLLCVQEDHLKIDDETFEGLSRAFNVSTEFLRNLDATWRKWPEKRSPFEPPEELFGPTSRRAILRVVK